MRNIISLDNLSPNIHILNKDLESIFKISPNNTHKPDTTILDICINEGEKRVILLLKQKIGACLQDYSLAFWEQGDGFKFEKTLNYTLTKLQTNIWHIGALKKWLTSDRSNTLRIWSMENGTSRTLGRHQ